MVFSKVAMSVLAVGGCASAIPVEYAENITIYHVNPLSEGVIPMNMDTADARGDIYFDFRSKVTPVECADNPESTDCANQEVTANDLVITKLVLEVDNRYGEYAACNICINGSAGVSGHDLNCTDGEYVCSCDHGSVPCGTAVGKRDLADHHGRHACTSSSPDYSCWRSNMGKKAGGLWYSTLDSGYCGDGASWNGCTWRVVELSKVVNKSCSDAIVHDAVEAQDDQQCFESCEDSGMGNTRNTSSPCWVGCFYRTVLGPDAASPDFKNTSGIPIEDIASMWEGSLDSCPDIRPALSQMVI